MTDEKAIAKNSKAIAYFTGFLCFVVFVYILIALKAILIPVTIAIFLTFLFHPLLGFFKKYKIPKWATIIFILLCLVVINYLLILLVISNVETFQERIQVYSENVSRFIQQALSPFNLTLKEFSEMVGLQTKDLEVNNIFHKLFETGIIGDMLNSVTSVLGDVFISMIFWLFMIMGKEKFEERLKLAFAGNGDTISRSVTVIDEQLQSYIFLKTLISLGTGIVTTIILLAYGIDFALFWGLLTFILNYIPNVGALIATIAPIIISLLENGLGFKTISMTVLILIAHNAFGNFLEPHYLGRQMDISPVFVLFSLIFWGLVWGIPGMFLAVPIAAAVKILFGNIEPLKPIAILISTKASTEGPKTKV